MSQRVKGLEGMRGVAAFLVYTHHFFLIFYPQFYFGPHSWINHLINPDLAVSWFFVHSGFVLAYKGSQLTGADYAHHLLDQSLRRYLRLLPVVFISIFLTYLVMLTGLNFNHHYGQMVGSSWLSQYLHFTPSAWEVLGQSLWGVYFNFKSSSTYNPSLWTIGYEMISSYLLFAILALVGWWKKAFWPLLLLALMISPWKGLMCFLLGAALTRLPPHGLPLFMMLPLTLLGFYLADLNGPYESYLRSLGAGLLMYCLLQAPRLREFLNVKWIHRLGEISYSLYALHFLLIVSLTSYLGTSWQAHTSLTLILLNYLITTLVLIMLSYVCWKWIDLPGIALAKRFSHYLLCRNQQAGLLPRILKLLK